MCRCTARGGCESEKGKKSWADEGSRRKPAISYAKQSGNTRCMHTASPRSKIIEHGPFHRKVAWKGRHADFSRSNPPPLTAPSSPALAIVQRVFPYCFPWCSPPTISRDSNVCNVCTRSTCHGCPIFEESNSEMLTNLSGWMIIMKFVCATILMILWFFFFFLESLENASIEEKDISVLRIYLDRR